MRLKGKVVLITASTRGIGLACAVRCAKEGAVVYMAARNMERAEARAQELNEQGYTVKTVFNDASDKDSYRTMVEEVIRQEGRIDVLVNNFGTSNPKKDLDIKSTEYEEFIGTLDMNLASVFLPVQAVIHIWQSRRWKYYQYFFHRRTSSGYLADCLWNEQSGN